MSVTANQMIVRQHTSRTWLPIAASTHIYEGTLVFVTAAGYADDDTATGANAFAGIANEEKDNSSGAAGDLNVELQNEGIFLLVGTGFAQADVGKAVYATDNFTISLAYAAGAVKIGVVREYVSSTKVTVEIDTKPNGDLEYAALAASAAVSNTVTETAFDKSFNFTANTLRAGDVIRVRLGVIATATNSTDTLTIKLYLGSVQIATTGALDVADNDVAYIDVDITIRTIGASGTLVALGAKSIGPPASATMKPFMLNSTTVDTTADAAVQAKATWSVASASNSCRLDVLNVQLLKRAA